MLLFAWLMECSAFLSASPMVHGDALCSRRRPRQVCLVNFSGSNGCASAWQPNEAFGALALHRRLTVMIIKLNPAVYRWPCTASTRGERGEPGPPSSRLCHRPAEAANGTVEVQSAGQIAVCLEIRRTAERSMQTHQSWKSDVHRPLGEPPGRSSLRSPL